MENKLRNFQENVKRDIELETEKLIQRFDGENQKLDKQFSEKLESGIRSVADRVSQIEKAVELEASNKNINKIKGNLEKKLDQQNSQNNILLDGLAIKLIDARTEFNTNVKLVDDKVENMDKEGIDKIRPRSEYNQR
jgi:septal ring factor EnvC (AmiA/AmiB activator)